MSVPAVRCRGLSKRYGDAPGYALHDLDLDVPEGSILMLLGPSGSGKTTALRLIAGFEAPDTGVVEVAGRRVAAPGYAEPPERRRLGMVFQGYALFPHLTVARNVGFGLRERGTRGERVAHALALTGLTGLGERMPHELSGGQQQRVALARALAPEPSVLLLDEPFSNLDVALRLQMREEVRDILKFTKTTAIFVTHDQDEALFMGDLVAVLNQGELQQAAPPEEIYTSPATRFVAEFLGTASFLRATVAGGQVETAVGTAAWDGEPRPDGVEVLLRPGDLTLEPSEAGQGVIIGRVFEGLSYLYEILLDVGEIVRVRLHHTRRYEGGTRVEVRMLPDRDPTCFVGERRIP